MIPENDTSQYDISKCVDLCVYMYVDGASIWVWLLDEGGHGCGGNTFYLAPEGVARYCFHPVCMCVYPVNILVFYFSAIRRDIDLVFIGLYSIH